LVEYAALQYEIESLKQEGIAMDVVSQDAAA
jgi:hypothetical protein